jgi:hypothetical protein
MKYTQESIDRIENFFQSNFNKSSLGEIKSKTSPRHGEKYISYKGLNKEELEILEDFSRNELGSSFKCLQAYLNGKVRLGKLTLNFDGKEVRPKAVHESAVEEPTTTSEQTTEDTPILRKPSKFDVLVKCCRLVEENKMSNEELLEIIINLY